MPTLRGCFYPGCSANVVLLNMVLCNLY
ncbi:hypothetical protein JMJ77_0011678 [Colletotrichum scovillei]|uniref:Uncharacterized protein n=1 Tax=Colletotrichum scovillei TaxID=1209932 RepID=A0A9P7U685_9PEZI|nr:hypothetical protein JMJ77_0011678 [Colletotrichum scovillei]KAG7045960.1 hypothetical protein JMJ78_0011031 [Colletotrichum scovillei]KAG7063305.1 hypothetical protein JMJ76_0005773 [Colletotrichum scovillei]